MPGTQLKRHELYNSAVSPDESVRRYTQCPQSGEIRMRVRGQRAKKQTLDPRPAELTRRQTDAVNHQEINDSFRRASVAVRGPDEAHAADEAGVAIHLGCRVLWLEALILHARMLP